MSCLLLGDRPPHTTRNQVTPHTTPHSTTTATTQGLGGNCLSPLRPTVVFCRGLWGGGDTWSLTPRCLASRIRCTVWWYRQRHCRYALSAASSTSLTSPHLTSPASSPPSFPSPLPGGLFFWVVSDLPCCSAFFTPKRTIKVRFCCSFFFCLKDFLIVSKIVNSSEFRGFGFQLRVFCFLDVFCFVLCCIFMRKLENTCFCGFLLFFIATTIAATTPTTTTTALCFFEVITKKIFPTSFEIVPNSVGSYFNSRLALCPLWRWTILAFQSPFCFLMAMLPLLVPPSEKCPCSPLCLRFQWCSKLLDKSSRQKKSEHHGW